MAKKVFVGNLPYTTTEDDLKDHFADQGRIVSARIINDRDTGRSRGFGFVEFENDGDADSAIVALHETAFGGRNLLVQPARPRQ